MKIIRKTLTVIIICGILFSGACYFKIPQYANAATQDTEMKVTYNNNSIPETEASVVSYILSEHESDKNKLVPDSFEITSSNLIEIKTQINNEYVFYTYNPVMGVLKTEKSALFLTNVERIIFNIIFNC